MVLARCTVKQFNDHWIIEWTGLHTLYHHWSRICELQAWRSKNQKSEQNNPQTYCWKVVKLGKAEFVVFLLKTSRTYWLHCTTQWYNNISISFIFIIIMIHDANWHHQIMNRLANHESWFCQLRNYVQQLMDIPVRLTFSSENDAEARAFCLRHQDCALAEGLRQRKTGRTTGLPRQWFAVRCILCSHNFKPEDQLQDPRVISKFNSLISDMWTTTKRNGWYDLVDDSMIWYVTLLFMIHDSWFMIWCFMLVTGMLCYVKLCYCQKNYGWSLEGRWNPKQFFRITAGKL